MALYSLTLGFLSRSEGRTSVGFSAYISGAEGHDKRTGQKFNYAHKEEVITSRILAPEGSPTWALDPDTLWNHVEAFEDYVAYKRFQGGEKSQLAKEKFLNSAQTAQTVMGALPTELTQEQSENAIEEFLKNRFVSRGLVVQYSIHWEEGNPHFHAMITRRALDGEEFSQRKDRDIVSKPELFVTRKQWAHVLNATLEKAGHDVRVDARSLKDQGSFFQATMHEGWHAQRLAEEGKFSRIVTDNEHIRQQNIEILASYPEALIHDLALKRTSFTRKHIEEEIIRRVGGDDRLFSVLKARLSGVDLEAMEDVSYAPSAMADMARGITERLLKDSTVVRSLGKGFQGQETFTSARVLDQHEQIMESVKILSEKDSPLEEGILEENLSLQEKEQGFTFSEQQKGALKYLCEGSHVRLLNGRAGTGKTTLLKAVAETYTQAGYTVLGASFQGKAVDIMAQEIGIKCQTLDSLIYGWSRHQTYKEVLEERKLWGGPYLRAHQTMKRLEKTLLTKKHVVIVDEANMVSMRLWEPFLAHAADVGAKVLLVQDTAQIQPRDPGSMSQVLHDTYGSFDLTQIMRQRVDWQRECSLQLSEHALRDGLTPYQEKGHINWVDERHQAIHALVTAYVKTFDPKKITQMALAHSNKEVLILNERIRSALEEKGFLGESFEHKGLSYAVGDLIRFTKNDNRGAFVKTSPRSLKERLISSQGSGIKNGSLGHIEHFKDQTLTVALEEGRRVQVNLNDYEHITYGYAMTIDKSEGSTFDRAYLLPSRILDALRMYVGMTRHRDDVQVFVDRETFTDFKDLVDILSRGKTSEIVQDHTIPEHKKIYFNRVQQHRELLMEAVTLREEMEGSLHADDPLFKHESYQTYKLLWQEKRRVAEAILKEWESHKPYARLAGIRRDVLEVEVGLRKRQLSDLEQRASVHVDQYLDVKITCQDLWEKITKTHSGPQVQEHALYKSFRDYKQERDQLAAEFVLNPKLYRPLVLEHSNGHSFIWKQIQDQAKAYDKAAQEIAFVNRLTEEEKGCYDKVKEYAKARSKAAGLFAEIKSLEGQGLKDSGLRSAFKEAQVTRNTLAFEVTQDISSSQKFLEHLNQDQKKLWVYADLGTPKTNLKTESHVMTKTTSYMRAEDVLEAARGRVDFIARSYLGEPNKQMSTSQSLRFGNKGSLVVHTSGTKEGLWFNHETGAGGNLINLVMEERCCSFKDAAQILGSQLGVRPETKEFTVKKEAPSSQNEASRIEQEKQEAHRRQDKLDSVQELWKRSEDIKGTLAETYLKDQRGITCDLSKDLRFIPKGTHFTYEGEPKYIHHDSFAAFTRNKEGEILSCQLTRLNLAGERATFPDGEAIPKTKYGVGKDGFVTVQKDLESNKVYIAEGVETALSLKQAGIKGTIVASQGIHNMKNYQGTETKIILVADNDDHKLGSKTQDVIQKTAAHYQGLNKDVTVIKPETPGHDFNDVLKERGTGEIRRSVGEFLDKAKGRGV